MSEESLPKKFNQFMPSKQKLIIDLLKDEIPKHRRKNP